MLATEAHEVDAQIGVADHYRPVLGLRETQRFVWCKVGPNEPHQLRDFGFLCGGCRPPEFGRGVLRLRLAIVGRMQFPTVKGCIDDHETRCALCQPRHSKQGARIKEDPHRFLPFFAS